MTKVLFIGDIHGKPKSPLDRLCDYNDDLFKKLEWIRDYCEEHQIKTIVHLGDIYDKPEAIDAWKNRFIQIWKSYSGTFYSIIGKAHDLFYNMEQSYSKTCLYNLELSGVIKVLKEPVRIDEVQLYPLSIHISQAKEQLKTIDEQLDVSLENILLAHQFYEWDLDLDAGFTKAELSMLKTNTKLILGHDHRQHESAIAGNCTVMRPGSLMRTELSETTITQLPRVLLYDDYHWSYLEVPHRSINEIYNVADYRAKKSTTKSFKQVKNGLENIDTYFHKDTTVISCSQALKNLKCPTAEYDYLKAVYQLCNQQF